MAVKWQHVPFCHKQQRIHLARKALELNSRGLTSCEIPSLFHLYYWLLQERSNNFLCFLPSATHSNYEGFGGSATSRNVSQISEWEFWKRNFLGISRSSSWICLSYFHCQPLEERKKTAAPGKD